MVSRRNGTLILVVRELGVKLIHKKRKKKKVASFSFLCGMKKHFSEPSLLLNLLQGKALKVQSSSI